MARTASSPQTRARIIVFRAFVGHEQLSIVEFASGFRGLRTWADGRHRRSLTRMTGAVIRAQE